MYVGLHVKYFYTSQILMKLEFHQQIFEKKLKYLIYLKSVQWEPSCSMQTDGRTDRHDKANSHFAKFCVCSLKSM